MSKYRLSVQIETDQRRQIEKRIQKEYPALKNTSELVRKALVEFLIKQ